MTNKVAPLAFGILFFFLGCAPAITPPATPAGPSAGLMTFIVDDGFRDGERAHIVTAARVWMRMGVPLVIVSGHDAFRDGVPPRAVWIVPVEKTACGAAAAGCWVPPGRIEFDADTLTSSGAWESVAQHEIGHALGLHDVSDGLSIMRSSNDDRARVPTYDDILAVKYRSP